MRLRFFGWLVLILLAVLPAIFSARAQQAELTGRWYGESYQGRGYQHWLAEMHADGVFSVEFRQYSECKVTHRSLEAGRWLVRDGYFITTITMIDGQRVNTPRQYRLLDVASDQIVYQHFPSGIIFRSRRAASDFDWPDCDPAKLLS
ncbi:hypothetical protein [Ferrovibrio sp.]|uniref:hypothetical protein n=1 Tax=Ferrovibrio sp. TaxID=1917215 RepID=UPI003D0A1DD0